MRNKVLCVVEKKITNNNKQKINKIHVVTVDCPSNNNVAVTVVNAGKVNDQQTNYFIAMPHAACRSRAVDC